MFLIAYAFKGQVHVIVGWVKIVSHSSSRTSAILKYFCPPIYGSVFLWHLIISEFWVHFKQAILVKIDQSAPQ